MHQAYKTHTSDEMHLQKVTLLCDCSVIRKKGSAQPKRSQNIGQLEAVGFQFCVFEDLYKREMTQRFHEPCSFVVSCYFSSLAQGDTYTENHIDMMAAMHGS